MKNLSTKKTMIKVISMKTDNMQNRARKHAHHCDNIVKRVNIIYVCCMLSYDFAKMDILEINEEKYFFTTIKRVFKCAEFSILFNSLNAKTNSLKFCNFCSLRNFF